MMMSIGHNSTRDTMRNPLLDIEEDISEKPFQHLPFFEKIGLTGALLITFAIFILSGISFFIDFVVKSNYLYALIDLSIILISLGAIYFIFNTFKRRIITEVLIDTAFQEGVYTRLEPLIENIAQAHVSTTTVLDRLSNIDLKVQNILKEQYAREIKASDFMEEPLAVGTSIKFAIKTIFLMIVTIAAFMFLVNFNLGGITPYTILLIFIMWWVFITNEYNLWKRVIGMDYGLFADPRCSCDCHAPGQPFELQCINGNDVRIRRHLHIFLLCLGGIFIHRKFTHRCAKEA